MNLPDITFVSSDVNDVETKLVDRYQQAVGVTVYQGDPVRLFLREIAHEVAQLQAVIDITAKRNLLAYATGDDLDLIADRQGIERLPAAAATTTIRFSIAAPLAFAVIIPAGTRVTPDKQLFFQTTDVAQVDIGATYVDIPAACLTAGDSGNGFVPGQIKMLVDPVPYVISAENTTTSSGGSDIETDANFKERIRLAPRSYSVAGPTGAYLYWARTAHQDIVDVSVTTTSPGVVTVRPLMTGGALPDQGILDAVETILSADTVRPLTDQVFVSAPVQSSYDIALTYYISRTDAALATSIAAAVDDAIDEYVTWQSSALGRDINPSELISRIQQAGVKRVVLTSPAYAVVTDDAVAAVGTVNVINGGLEDD